MGSSNLPGVPTFLQDLVCLLAGEEGCSTFPRVVVSETDAHSDTSLLGT